MQRESPEPFWNWKSEEEVERSEPFRNRVVAGTISRFADKESVRSIFTENLSNLSRQQTTQIGQ